jgi:hypothetical protein
LMLLLVYHCLMTPLKQFLFSRPCWTYLPVQSLSPALDSDRVKGHLECAILHKTKPIVLKSILSIKTQLCLSSTYLKDSSPIIK